MFSENIMSLHKPLYLQELKRKIFELEEEKEGLRVRYESEVKGPAKEQQEKEVCCCVGQSTCTMISCWYPPPPPLSHLYHA